MTQYQTICGGRLMSDKYYEGILTELSERMWSGIEEINKIHNTSHGFIGLVIRDPTVGNVDIMHNCTNEEYLIKILDVTLQQLKENRDGNTST